MKKLKTIYKTHQSLLFILLIFVAFFLGFKLNHYLYIDDLQPATSSTLNNNSQDLNDWADRVLGVSSTGFASQKSDKGIGVVLRADDKGHLKEIVNQLNEDIIIDEISEETEDIIISGQNIQDNESISIKIESINELENNTKEELDEADTTVSTDEIDVNELIEETATISSIPVEGMILNTNESETIEASFEANIDPEVIIIEDINKNNDDKKESSESAKKNIKKVKKLKEPKQKNQGDVLGVTTQINKERLLLYKHFYLLLFITNLIF